VQIVTSPVTDGSLSSCPPSEAVTWGKVDRDTYQQSTESLQADYSIVMPFLVKALLDNRERYAADAARVGEAELFRQEPKARGYLRPREGYRLFTQREAIVRTADGGCPVTRRRAAAGDAAVSSVPALETEIESKGMCYDLRYALRGR
jgi:hypothetical protein